MLLYPNLPKNVAQDKEAGPPPTKDILACVCLGEGVLGSLVCFTPILLKIFNKRYSVELFRII